MNGPASSAGNASGIAANVLTGASMYSAYPPSKSMPVTLRWTHIAKSPRRHWSEPRQNNMAIGIAALFSVFAALAAYALAPRSEMHRLFWRAAVAHETMSVMPADAHALPGPPCANVVADGID